MYMRDASKIAGIAGVVFGLGMLLTFFTDSHAGRDGLLLFGSLSLVAGVYSLRKSAKKPS
jgi:F0F1-type ATP synthase assembly protein I